MSRPDKYEFMVAPLTFRISVHPPHCITVADGRKYIIQLILLFLFPLFRRRIGKALMVLATHICGAFEIPKAKVNMSFILKKSLQLVRFLHCSFCKITHIIRIQTEIIISMNMAILCLLMVLVGMDWHSEHMGKLICLVTAHWQRRQLETAGGIVFSRVII